MQLTYEVFNFAGSLLLLLLSLSLFTYHLALSNLSWHCLISLGHFPLSDYVTLSNKFLSHFFQNYRNQCTTIWSPSHELFVLCQWSEDNSKVSFSSKEPYHSSVWLELMASLLSQKPHEHNLVVPPAPASCSQNPPPGYSNSQVM